MTVPTSRASTDPVATDGSTRTWTYNFRIDLAADARLAVVDTAGNDSYPDPSLWDIAGLGSDNGGSITYPKAGTDPLEAGSYIRIDRWPALTQQTSLLNQGAYSPDVVERMCDRLTWQVQAIMEWGLRQQARIDALIAIFPNIDPADLGNLSDYVQSALDASTAAVAAATSAEDSATAASDAASDAGEALSDVQDLRDLVDAMVNGSDDYAPGKPTAITVLTTIQSLLATAPITNEITIGPHTGEAGSDGVTQTFTATAAHLGAVVRFTRGANRPAKYKIPADLLQTIVPAGFDGRVAFIRVINDMGGTSSLTLEGPADPGSSTPVLSKPTIIAQGVQPISDNNATNSARTVSVVLNIPAASNRAFKASCYFIGQTTPSGTVTLTCSSASNITVRGSDGGSTGPTGTDPILTRVWTGDIAGTASITGASFDFAIPANCASCVAIVQVINNVSGHEDYVCTARDSTATSEGAAVNPSAALGSLVVVDAAHQGADALTGLTISGLDALSVDKTPLNRAPKDLAYALGYDADRATGAVTYTASSSKAGPGSITAVVFLPISTTVGGSGEDNLIYAGTDKVLAPKEQADIIVHSSGLRYFLSWVPIL